MINIKKKEDCCGCSACAQRCPKQCIVMQADNDGFLYPVVDKSVCIDCGLCEKVCPVINQNEQQETLITYAAINKNEETRMSSSSGGIFTLLAEETIKRGGVVFGVKFNKDWMAQFDYTENIEGILPFRGSKYVQAIVGDVYKQTETFLKNGREVLFTGTPCQIAGLKKYLHKEYTNLTTVDIICHGVPSPEVWSKYLEETTTDCITKYFGKNSVPSVLKNEGWKSCIEHISFRCKVSGWKKFSFILKLNFSKFHKKNTFFLQQPFTINTYMRCFMRNLCLRPSCYQCPAKQGKSHSDITLADFWGINKVMPQIDDDKGISAVIVNTSKGDKMFKAIKCYKEDTNIEYVKQYNSAYIRSCSIPSNRTKFFEEVRNGARISKLVDNLLYTPLYKKIINKIKRLLNIEK